MIRDYRPEDADAVVAIWQSANALSQPFLSAEFVARVSVDIRTLYLPHAETFVMEAHSDAVGFIALLDQEIGGLFLEPAWHGKGLGKALVDHAIARKGALHLEVFERNAIGRRFYQRYGFIETGRYIHQASGEVTLKLELPNR
ncbi:MAG: GNAT family N-acetyltransferase [Hyphomicrobiaceae bacterium]